MTFIVLDLHVYDHAWGHPNCSLFVYFFFSNLRLGHLRLDFQTRMKNGRAKSPKPKFTKPVNEGSKDSKLKIGNAVEIGKANCPIFLD